MRYRLRTLLIAAAVIPPLVGGAWYLSQSSQGSLILALVAVFGTYFVASFWLSPRIGPPNN